MITRRKFIAFLTSLPLYFGCRSAENKTVAREVILGSVEDFLQPVTPLPLYRLIIRNEGTVNNPQFRALSLICTHQHCALSVRDDLKELHCPCHGAKFDFEGRVIQGPATESLHLYKSRIEAGKLVVDLAT